MKRFNVQLNSLHSTHPMLKNVTNPREVQKLKKQLKVLSGDFYTNSIIGERQQTSQKCLLCEYFCEDDIHVLGLNGCPALMAPKTRIFNEMTEAAANFQPPLTISTDDNIFTQYVCDPTSFNLPPNFRVNLNKLEECDIMFKLTRDYIFTITQLRAKKIEKILGKMYKSNTYKSTNIYSTMQ